MDEFCKEPNWDKSNYKSFHYCEILEKSHLYAAAINERLREKFYAR